jgi:hypothetical protein
MRNTYYIRTPYKQDVEFLDDELCGTYSNHWAFEGQIPAVRAFNVYANKVYRFCDVIVRGRTDPQIWNDQ